MWRMWLIYGLPLLYVIVATGIAWRSPGSRPPTTLTFLLLVLPAAIFGLLISLYVLASVGPIAVVAVIAVAVGASLARGSRRRPRDADGGLESV